jgi:PAS domain S-box-containing protein
MTVIAQRDTVYHDIVEKSPAAILYADREGIIRIWNAGCEALFGFTAEEAVGESLDIIVPEKQRPRHWEGWKRVMETGITKYGRDPLAVPALRKDGSRVSIEFHILLLPDGAAAILRDVTAQYQLQKELKTRLAEVRRVTDLTAPDGHGIPALLFTPPVPRGAAVICHGYGASKEQMLGVAEAVVEKKFAALVIDLCGHGENTAPIGPGMREEVDAAVAYLRRFGKVAVVGHSLGGRLALMSSADVMVAMSPSVMMQMSPQGKWMFENLPSPGIREPYSGYVLELLEKLGPVPAHDRPCLLLYSERDIQGLLDGAGDLQAQLPRSEKQIISDEIRPEVQHENGFIRYLPHWFNHLEIRFNAAACQAVGAWLAAHLA